MKAGDPVLVKDDYIAELYSEGPLQTYVELLAGCTGYIDHFGEEGEVCISFYDEYYIIAELDDFDYDGVLMINYTQKQKDLIMKELNQPLLQIVKKDN